MSRCHVCTVYDVRCTWQRRNEIKAEKMSTNWHPKWNIGNSGELILIGYWERTTNSSLALAQRARRAAAWAGACEMRICIVPSRWIQSTQWAFTCHFCAANNVYVVYVRRSFVAYFAYSVNGDRLFYAKQISCVVAARFDFLDAAISYRSFRYTLEPFGIFVCVCRSCLHLLRTCAFSDLVIFIIFASFLLFESYHRNMFREITQRIRFEIYLFQVTAHQQNRNHHHWQA